MLKLFKNKKAQNTAEYAILIALVVGGVIAMQTYAQRTLQGRLRDASVMFRDSTTEIGNTLQYEPYYTNTSAQTDKGSKKEQTIDQQLDTTISTKRAAGYVDTTNYNKNTVSASNSALSGEAASGY